MHAVCKTLDVVNFATMWCIIFIHSYVLALASTSPLSSLSPVYIILYRDWKILKHGQPQAESFATFRKSNMSRGLRMSTTAALPPTGHDYLHLPSTSYMYYCITLLDIPPPASSSPLTRFSNFSPGVCVLSRLGLALYYCMLFSIC